MPDLHTLGPLAVYLLVTGLVYAESGLLVGFFLPGDTVLFTAGLLSGQRSHHLSLALLVVLVVVAAVAGDATGFALGRRAGPRVLRRLDKRHDEVEKARAFYDRYGAPSVVAARFVPWVRTFTPLLAGMAGMPYRRFVVANVVGALVWGAGLLVVGRLSSTVHWLKTTSYVVAGVFVAGSVVVGAVQARRARRSRTEV